MTHILIATIATLVVASAALAQGDYMGNLSANPYAGPNRSYPDGTFDNPYGTSGTSPKLYDSEGNFRGNLNANPYDPDSVANPYGRYGSEYSPDSIANPYGQYGSRYGAESPNNPYGQGLRIYR